jgi:transcriptional antiterminator RfaH
MLAPNGKTPAHWHVLLTHPREERRAESGLRDIGVSIYLPAINVRFRRGRRMVDGISPMFPGYLFTPADPGIPWAGIRMTRGIRCQGNGSPALLDAGRPGRVPGWAIEIVMAKEGKLHKGVEKPPGSFTLGQAIEVISGPFAWFRGEIDDLCRLDTHGRVSASVEIFGRLTRLELEAPQIRAV